MSFLESKSQRQRLYGYYAVGVVDADLIDDPDCEVHGCSQTYVRPVSVCTLPLHRGL